MNCLPAAVVAHLDGRPVDIEHVVQGPARRCAAFATSLPEGMTAREIEGGLIVMHASPVEVCRIEAEAARVSRLAEAVRLDYDGWGVTVGAAASGSPRRVPVREGFTARTAIAPGRCFGFRRSMTSRDAWDRSRCGATTSGGRCRFAWTGKGFECPTPMSTPCGPRKSVVADG